MSEANHRDDPRQEDSGPRPEPAPQPWDRLTVEQQRAAEQALVLVSQLARPTGTDAEHWGEHLAQLFHDRKNHVIMLDGDRGSGKTTLLVSLLYAWGARRAREVDARAARQPDFDELLTKTGDEHIVPLRILDLRPFPDSRELILSIAGRLERVIRMLERLTGPTTAEHRPTADWGPLPSPLSGNHAESSARSAWRAFAQAVGMGWARGRQRLSEVDVEEFALQLEDAEMRGMDIERSFARLMDTLVEDYTRILRAHGQLVGDRRPLFVIPIDDADMNPGRSMEVLDLMRALWHPRLVFLVTGHSALFQAVLRQRLFADITGARTTTQAMMADAETRATRLAQDVFRKVVPPAHRCSLLGLAPHARWQWLQQRHGQKQGAFGWRRLLAELDSFPGPKACLPRFMRQLVDTEQALTTIIAQAHAEARAEGQAADEDAVLARMVAALWRQVLDRHGTDLDPNLQSLIAWTSERRREFRLGPLALKFERERLEFAQGERMSFHVPGQRLVSASDTPLPPEIVAGYALAARVARGSKVSWLHLRLSFMAWVEIQVRVQGVISTVDTGWFLPRLPVQQPMRAAVRVRGRWRAAVEQFRAAGDDPTDDAYRALFWSFVSLAVDAHRPDAGQDVRVTLAECLADELNLPWGQALTGSYDPRASFETWLVHELPLMAAPEYGLPAAVANEVLALYRRHVPPAVWELQRDLWREQRQERLDLIKPGLLQGTALYAALAQAFPEYDIERKKPPETSPQSAAFVRQELVRRFRNLLRNVKLMTTSQSIWPDSQRCTLIYLVQAEHRGALLDEIPAEHLQPLLPIMERMAAADGVSQDLLHLLWREAVQLNTGPSSLQEDTMSLVTLDDNVLSIRPWPIWPSGHKQVSITDAEGVTITIASTLDSGAFIWYGDDDEEAGTKYFPPLLELLYRMAWDVCTANTGQTTSTDDKVLPAVRIEHPEGTLLWPRPVGLPLFTREYIEANWNQCVPAPLLTEPPPAKSLLRILARWWLTNLAVALSNPFRHWEPFKVDRGLSLASLKNMQSRVGEYHNIYSKNPFIPRNPVHDWRFTWPILAAPEFGLDTEGAQEILDSLAEMPGEAADESQRAAIVAHREQYLEQSLGAEQAAALRARLDTDDHPFVRFARGEDRRRES